MRHDYVSNLALFCLDIKSAELYGIAEIHEVFRSILGLLSHDPSLGKTSMEMNELFNLKLRFMS